MAKRILGRVRKVLVFTRTLVAITLNVMVHHQTQAGDVLALIATAEPSYRVPIDVVWQREQLFVANSRTGTVSSIDPIRRRVIAEWKAAPSLSGMAGYRDGLLLLDDRNHQLICAVPQPESRDLKTVFKMDVPRYPVDVAVSADDATVAVSSLWSRKLTLLKGHGDTLQIQDSVDLPFSPRELKFLPNGMLVVADSFGGHLAVIDVATARILKQHDVYGHNIRGLGFNPGKETLLVACQTLDASTFTSYERVFWGNVMQNGLHSVPLNELLSESSAAGDQPVEDSEYGSSYSQQQQYPLGTPSVGSGDPGEMVVTDDDTTLLLVSGVNQVAFRTASHLPFERLKTGRRPEAICLDQSQQRAFIANRFSDSITVISLTGESPVVECTIPLGTNSEPTLAEQGEQLFYDATVSLDGWFSCHSCHTDGHTNGLRADTFGDDDRGAPKKVVSLLGTTTAGPWAWTGNKTELEEQIKTSLIISMQTQITTDLLPVEPLMAYLKTLKPAPSIQEARGETVSSEVLISANREFESIGCRSCHSGDAFTSSDAFDVGIHDEKGETMFNPPSLRGVSQRAPYFHDGRAASIVDVLKSSHHNPEKPLSEQQIELLTQLLETL